MGFWLGPMLALRDDHAFDAIGGYLIEANGEKKSARVDYLDLLPDASPQRPGEVAGVAAEDDGAPAFTLGEKRRHAAYIIENVS